MKYVSVFYILFLFCLNIYPQDPFSLAQTDIDTLCSKEFAGRGFMLGGHKKAAAYLASRFKEIGLEPLSEDYKQEFEIELNIFEEVPYLSISGKALMIGKDFMPYALSGSGKCAGQPPVIYVKSGLYIPEKNINDYAEVNDSNAVVLIDEEVPLSIKNDKDIDPQFYSREYRIKAAEIAKAAAVIFLVKKLSYSRPYTRYDIPIFDLLDTNTAKPPAEILYKVKSSFKKFIAENIIGRLPGKNGKDSAIIICAHYDHAGGFADSLYFPGANDNASGTSMLLELAEYFMDNPPEYSILFIAFSGEEEGLIGSKYYTENPLEPLGKTVFLINMDMVASGDDGVMVVGGTNYPDYYDILSRLNDSLDAGPLYRRPTAPNSDHFFFSQRGIKTLYLYSNKGKQPYHSFYDVPETLDRNAFNHVYELVKGLIININKAKRN